MPTTGIYMANALPRIIEIAGPRIGRETLKPVVAKATPEGTIEYGELQVIGIEGEDAEIVVPPAQNQPAAP